MLSVSMQGPACNDESRGHMLIDDGLHVPKAQSLKLDFVTVHSTDNISMVLIVSEYLV